MGRVQCLMGACPVSDSNRGVSVGGEGGGGGEGGRGEWEV